MFFAQTSLGARTVHGLILCLGKLLPSAPPPPPIPPYFQISKLFDELASLSRPRFGLLGIFTDELVSPYFHDYITFFIHILKKNHFMVWTMSKSL